MLICLPNQTEIHNLFYPVNGSLKNVKPFNIAKCKCFVQKEVGVNSRTTLTIRSSHGHLKSLLHSLHHKTVMFQTVAGQHFPSEEFELDSCAVKET